MNKPFIGMMVVLAAVAAVALGQAAGTSTTTTETVLEVLQRNSSTSTLFDLIVTHFSPGMINALNSTANEWTIFAPTDFAFSFFDSGSTGFTIGQILRYHVVNTTSLQLFDGALIPTELLLPSLGGASQMVKVTLGRRGVYINSNLVVDNVTASNGNVIFLDNVLLPPLNFTEVINNTGVFRILSSILADPNITHMFPDGLPFDDSVTTVFAPTDAAFAVSDPAIYGIMTGTGIYQNLDLIAQILESHIVSNRILYLTDIINTISSGAGSGSGSDSGSDSGLSCPSGSSDSSDSSSSCMIVVDNLLGQQLTLTIVPLSSVSSAGPSDASDSSDSTDSILVLKDAFDSPVVKNVVVVQGGSLQNVSNLDNSAFVSSNVRLNDILTLGGVAHAISNVLLPNDIAFTVEDVLLGLRCVEFMNIIRQAGLDDLLMEPTHNFTIFCPMDDFINSELNNATLLSKMHLHYVLNGTTLFNLSTSYQELVTLSDNTLLINVDPYFASTNFAINNVNKFTPNIFQFANLTTVTLEGSPFIARVVQRSLLAKSVAVYAIDNILSPLYEPFISLLL